jgi:hypothetical protein
MKISTDPNTPFAANGCKARLLEDRPGRAVMFTQPLDGAQKLDDAMRMIDLGPISRRKETVDRAVRRGTARRGRERGAAGHGAAGRLGHFRTSIERSTTLRGQFGLSRLLRRHHIWRHDSGECR